MNGFLVVIPFALMSISLILAVLYYFHIANKYLYICDRIQISKNNVLYVQLSLVIIIS